MKPCIRGLKEFKKGCPENTSCPAWIETLGKLQPLVIKQCADIAVVHLLWDLNCNMIRNEQAVESFRNEAAESAPIILRILTHGINTKTFEIAENTGDDREGQSRVRSLPSGS